MKTYHNLLKFVLEQGERVPTRAKLLSTGTNVSAYSVIGYQDRYDLKEGFPLLTTKKIHFKSVLHELFWFLNGDTNVKYLNDHGVRIWNEWANEQGDIGAAYGQQWRAWDFHSTEIVKNKYENAFFKEFGVCTHKKIDQIQQLIDGIEAVKADPTASVGRRLILTAWNVPKIPEMALPPCHTLSQFFVRGNRLSCKLYQRSADAFLGVPFNIASYALLTHLLAARTGLKPDIFVHTYGDLHIYENHIEQVIEQLSRPFLPLPQLNVKNVTTDLKNLKEENVELIGYQCAGPLKAEVAV